MNSFRLPSIHLNFSCEEKFLAAFSANVRRSRSSPSLSPSGPSPRIVVVKVVTESGVVGWGECVAVVSPKTVTTIVEDLVGPLARGRNAHDVMAIHEDFYDAMRVRGFFGGFYLDALAALDIALWDVRGKLTDLPVCRLLGGKRIDRLPVYVSGLPGKTLADLAALARSWVEKGFRAVRAPLGTIP